MYPTENNTHCGAAEFEERNDGKPPHVVIMMPDSPSPSISKPKSNGFWTKKRIVCIVMAVLVLIGCGAGAVWYLCVHDGKKKDSSMHATPTNSIQREKSKQSRENDENWEKQKQREHDELRRDWIKQVEDESRQRERQREEESQRVLIEEVAKLKKVFDKKSGKTAQEIEEFMRTTIKAAFERIRRYGIGLEAEFIRKFGDPKVASEIEQLFQNGKVDEAAEKVEKWKKDFEKQYGA